MIWLAQGVRILLVPRRLRLALGTLLALAPPLPAQTPQSPSHSPEPLAAATSSGQSEVPDVPGLSRYLRGLNAGITIAGVHDSVTGWATLATPAVGYSFNDVFNVDASIPIYMYRLAESRAARPRPNALLVNQRAELGDVVIGLHASFVPRLFQYQATVALTAPTGDEIYGLTSGRVTADFNNRFERTFARLTPSVELGVGDSTTLINRLVTKSYTTLGPLAHFQAGLGLQLPRALSFEANAYEQLPIGDQKIYGPARRGRGTVVTGRNAAEDNGFTTALNVPVDAHTSFSGYYSRSLRLRVDSVAIGVTCILRVPPSPEPDNDIDDLFR